MINSFITAHETSPNLDKEVEINLLPDLILSNYEPQLILDLATTYYQEKTIVFSTEEKLKYIKAVKKELKKQQRVASNFRPYHHHEQPTALNLLIQSCQEEIKHLRLMITEDAQAQASDQYPKLDFNLQRKDLTIFFLLLKDIGLIDPELSDYQLAQCLEASTTYEGGKPMKSIKSLCAKYRSGEVLPSPRLVEMCEELLAFLEKSSLGN